MESLYDKQCKGMYLQKYTKKGNLLRTAEQYKNGSWVISEYPSSRTNMQLFLEQCKNILKIIVLLFAM